MNQIVHIFRKDCRRLWPTITAVLVFTFLHGYGDAINPGGAVAIGLSPYALLFVLTSLSGLILPVAVFLLVVSVIQEESLVGSDKFWLTRPYARRSLALEKLLFVVLWAFLPMLLHDLILIRYFGFPLSSAFGLLLWKNAQFGFFLLAAAALAVLSASFARAVLLAIAAVFVAVLAFFMVLQTAVGPAVVGSWKATYEILIVLAVAAVGALCVVAFQYRFRITSVAVAIGVLGLLICTLLVRFWPSSLSAYLLQKSESPSLRSVQILPDQDLKDIARPPEISDPATQARAAYYPFRALGLSDGVGVELVGLSAHFDPPGQKSTTFYLAAMVRFQPHATGSGRFANASGPEQLVSFAPPFPGDYDRLKDLDGTLSGSLVLQGFHSTVARVVAPQPQQRHDFAIAGRRCKVGSFLRENNFVLTFDCVELEPGNTSGFQVRLVQNNREIMPSGTSGQPSSVGGWPSFLSPITRSNYTFEFIPPATRIGLSREPIDKPDMLVFSEQNLGAVVRAFRIEHLRPSEFTLQAWEQRGVLSAESTATQTNGGTSPRNQ